MTYSQASELLRLTTPKSPKAQAELAKTRLSTFTTKTPLRFKVACQVLINAVK